MAKKKKEILLILLLSIQVLVQSRMIDAQNHVTPRISRSATGSGFKVTSECHNTVLVTRDAQGKIYHVWDNVRKKSFKIPYIPCLP